jgi:hypothetical protein
LAAFAALFIYTLKKQFSRSLASMQLGVDDFCEFLFHSDSAKRFYQMHKVNFEGVKISSPFYLRHFSPDVFSIFSSLSARMDSKFFDHIATPESLKIL